MTIEDRLDRLETQNHRLKGGLGLMLLTVVAVAVLGFTGQDNVPDVVKAKAFHVVTDDGAVLLKLEDSQGLRIGLAGTVVTLNGKGQALVRLGSTSDGDGMVAVFDPSGRERPLLLTTRPPGRPKRNAGTPRP